MDITSIRSSTYAAIFIYLSAIFTIIAFSTPYWLSSDGKQAVKHFDNLGLWEACFTRFSDPNYLYDRQFIGCKWLFDEDYTFLSNILEPPFFIVTQTLYTIGLVFLLIGVLGVLAIQLCFVVEKEVYAMRVLAVITLISAKCMTIAVLVFGIWGDDRDWMPDPEHNYLSWSFALAVVGTLYQWASTTLFWIESRILSKRTVRKRDNYKLEQTINA